VAERKPPLILLGSPAGNRRSTGVEGIEFGWQEAPWLGDAALYEGVRTRRCVAYFLDAILCLVISILLGLATCTLTVGTLGFLSIPGFILTTPFIHFVLAAATIGGRRAATPGMRAMGLQVVAWTGDHPGPLRAILLPALFYATVPTTGFLLLLFSLFDGRGRCLHDHLAGVLVFRTEAAARASVRL
jgi:uncharacterized RDD family membrane protein YckC